MTAMRVLAGFGFGVLSSVAVAQPAPAPHHRVPLIETAHAVPATPRHDVTDTYFGSVVHDPYRWLEDADAPAVKRWIAAQNAYTEKTMEGFADAKAIARRVGKLALTSTRKSSPEIVGDTAAALGFFAQELGLGAPLESKK